MSGPGAGGGGSGDIFGGGKSVYPPAPPGYKYVDLNIPQAPPGYRVADMKNVANNQSTPVATLGGNAGLVRGVSGYAGGGGRLGFAGAHTQLGIQQREDLRMRDAAMRAAYRERGLVEEYVKQGIDPRTMGIDMKKYGWTDNTGTGTGANNIPQPSAMSGGGAPPVAAGSTPGAATPAVAVDPIAMWARRTVPKQLAHTPEGTLQSEVIKLSRQVLLEKQQAFMNNVPWDENSSPAATTLKGYFARTQPGVSQTPTTPPASNIATPQPATLPTEVRAAAPPSAPPAAAPPAEMKHSSILELLGNMRDNILGHGKPETPVTRETESRDPFSPNPNAAMRYDELGDEGQ